MKLSPNTRIIDLTVEEFASLIKSCTATTTPAQNSNVLHQNNRKVNLTQLCELFSWHRQTVYGWISKRLIPHFKIGKRLMFDLDKIEKWIAEHHVKTREEL